MPGWEYVVVRVAPGGGPKGNPSHECSAAGARGIIAFASQPQPDVPRRHGGRAECSCGSPGVVGVRKGIALARGRSQRDSRTSPGYAPGGRSGLSSGSGVGAPGGGGAPLWSGMSQPGSGFADESQYTDVEW